MVRGSHPKRLSKMATNSLSVDKGLIKNGAEGIRTPYLLVANEALSLLSYSPTINAARDRLPDANEALPDEIGTTAPQQKNI